MADADPPPLDQQRLERRLLLVPPTVRDGEVIAGVLAEFSFDCDVLPSIPAVCAHLDSGAGAIAVSEESLVADSECLLEALSRQPVWSDVPVIVLSRAGSESPRLAALLERTGSVSVVERPVRISTFLSLVRVALRSRERQYQVREHLAHLRAMEAERTTLYESEKSARAEAERAGRMKDEFLATLSHEIRTPLNAILGWTHILGKGAASPQDIEKGLAVIERNARVQAQIVADLLDMSRIINGKVRLDARRVPLAPVIQAAIDTVTPAADAKGVRLRIQLDAASAHVHGDPERLQQVFWNLLSNAVKFTPRDGSVQVSSTSSGRHIRVCVTDSGEGISPEFLPHVFDRFRQADGSTTRRHGGLGLGLAIVKQLLDLHGGSVSAASRGPGRGSEFCVTLPTAPAGEEPSVAAPAAVAALAHSAPSAPPPDISGVRIVVVDDEADSRDVVVELLREGGAAVSAASSAREALELIRQFRPDVLVSDIAMPGEDGHALLRQLRARPVEHGGATVAVALTAYARPEDHKAALHSGFQYHVAKPVEPSELLAVVAEASRSTGAIPRRPRCQEPTSAPG